MLPQQFAAQETKHLLQQESDDKMCYFIEL